MCLATYSSLVVTQNDCSPRRQVSEAIDWYTYHDLGQALVHNTVLFPGTVIPESTKALTKGAFSDY